MRKLLIVMLLTGVVLAACASGAGQLVDESRLVTIYKLPTWGCCGDWAEYLQGNGFQVKTEDLSSLSQIKQEYHVPAELQSCHTAIVDGYVIEGHVPVKEIERLLAERPSLIGIGVAGMPAGSPGMEIEGFDNEPFVVVSFDENGLIEIFASYQ